ncbi:MAG: hypothetical protein HY721_09085 [Planctomycetes bacterium]|nr:hypothetical protein [Planctomycetota bacterium]
MLDSDSRAAAASEERFAALTAKWRADTAHLSSASAIAMHPAYQEIIGMGAAALPFILRELERQPDHWFWALHAITREDPVRAVHRGKVAEMAKSWVEWGRDRGLIG